MTPEELEDTVKSLLSQGTSCRETARITGVSLFAACKHRKRLQESGVVIPKVISSLGRQIQELLSQGVACREVASILHCSIGVVYHYRDTNLILPASKTYEETREKVKSLLLQGESCTAIATRLSLGLMTVYRHRDRLVEDGEIDLENRYSVQSPDGQVYSAKTLSELARKTGLSPKGLSALKRGEQQSHHRWTLPRPQSTEAL